MSCTNTCKQLLIILVEDVLLGSTISLNTVQLPWPFGNLKNDHLAIKTQI